jgi:hypothetical protein
MAVIVARPVASDEGTEGTELITLNILVEAADFEGSFDQLEIWRAETETGPYEEMTAAAWAPPRIPKAGKDAPSSPIPGRLVSVVGKTITIQAIESAEFEMVVTFTGTDPLTYSQAAGQVVAQGQGRLRAYVDPDGLFILESTLAGVWSRLRVVGGDAAPLLGLPTEEPDSLASGRDARLMLRAGIERYDFRDPFGTGETVYRTRFRNRSTGATSAFSQPFGVEDVGVGVSAEGVILGRVDLVGVDGQPVVNAEVTVYGASRAVMVDGKLVMWEPTMKRTDKNGRVEFMLVRGISATVSISGSSVVRDIVVPTDEDILVFNLLGSEAGATDDNFKVVVPQLTYAERRSL